MRRCTGRPIAAALVLGFTWLAAVPAVVPAAAQAAAPAAAQVAPDAETGFVTRINDLRRSKGLQDLATDGALLSVARRWAASMAAAGAISHNPKLRNEIPEPWERAGENVGVGPSVASLHDAFVASASHYRNLVDSGFSRVAVGVVRTADGTLYATQLFLQPPRSTVPARASRSRPPAAAGAAAPSSPDRATPPSSTVPATPSSERVASVSLAEPGAGTRVSWTLVIAGVLAAALLIVPVRVHRRRVRGRRAAKARVEAVLAALAPYEVSRVAAGWHLEQVGAGVDDVVLVVAGGHVRGASLSTERMLGYGPGALAGVSTGDLIHPADAAIAAPGSEQARAEMRLRHRDGSWRHVEITTEDRGDDTGMGGTLVRGTDVTERRAAEAELRNRVERDPVTGLVGRAALLDRVANIIESLDDSTEVAAVLAVHLEGLDVVHEAHGPAIVDCLVGAAADRLQEVAGPTALVGRYGEHDFAVACSAAARDAAPTDVARAVLVALGDPFVALAEPVTLVPSVGVAVVERCDVPAAQALQQAYVAMRTAQRRHRDGIEVFRPALSGPAVSRLRDERALRIALARRELCLHYQPIVRAATGDMVGVEALMRWAHPERGVISAGEFIGVAEEAGLITELGWWALVAACREAARWARVDTTFRVSVNVAARQLGDSHFADRVLGTLADADAPPSSLSLELTETSLLDDLADGAHQLETVRGAGVTVAVDDFGTGYSSLGYLQQLPIDTIKIDRSFVTDLGHTPEADTIASAVVGLARGLGLGTVAEGVETEAQAATLAGLGCDHFQGYLCSPARPASEIDGLFGTPLVDGVIDLSDRAPAPRSALR